MQPPENTELFELPTATYWFDEDGILYCRSKNVPGNLEIMKKTIAFLKHLLNNNKVCIIIDATHVSPLDKETREFTASEINNLYTAIAILSKSAIGKMIVNIFFMLKKPSVPMKMFTHEKEAKEWLKQYLQKPLEVYGNSGKD